MRARLHARRVQHLPLQAGGGGADVGEFDHGRNCRREWRRKAQSGGFPTISVFHVASTRVIVRTRQQVLEAFPHGQAFGGFAGTPLAGSERRAGAGLDVLAFRADAGGQAGRQVQCAARPERPAVAGGPPPGVARAGAGAPARIPGAPLQGQRVLARPRAARPRRNSSTAMASGAAPTRKARCSSTWTNTPRTSPRTCCRCWPSPATG